MLNGNITTFLGLDCDQYHLLDLLVTDLENLKILLIKKQDSTKATLPTIVDDTRYQ